MPHDLAGDEYAAELHAHQRGAALRWVAHNPGSQLKRQSCQRRRKQVLGTQRNTATRVDRCDPTLLQAL